MRYLSHQNCVLWLPGGGRHAETAECRPGNKPKNRGNNRVYLRGAEKSAENCSEKSALGNGNLT